jgi:DNA-binding transcriptional ArsR family regulator
MTTVEEKAELVFNALGDANRRRILTMLRSGPRSISELHAPLSVTIAAVVQHVQVLEQSGLVSSQKDGRTRTCRIANQGFEVAYDWLRNRQSALSDNLGRLGAYLDRGATATETDGF